MRRLFPVVVLTVAFLATPARSVQNEQGLRSIATQRDFYVGATVSVSALNDDPLYRETLVREFNTVVAENAFKFENLHPDPDRYYFTEADALVAFAEQNHMKVRGHTLVWHSQLPKWMTARRWSRSEAIALMRDHIETVVGRYKGRIWAWDVVNEAIDENQKDGFRQDSFWYRTIGPDYVKLAFQMAREADPGAILYYNDFSIEDKGKKSEFVFRLLSRLEREGVPVDGMGWQMHIAAGFKIKNEHRQNAERLAALGLELSITELDVRIKLPGDADSERKQAETFGDVAMFCLTQPNCRALVLWGFTDKHSWIPSVFNGEGEALIFDESYHPKPAYTRIRQVLEEAVSGAPRITNATFADGLLVVNGEDFDHGSALLIEGRIVASGRSRTEGSLTLSRAEKFLPAGRLLRLQVRNTSGKLSVERRFTREDGLLP
ncbi:MAG: endo-1,4-beta-xylanase [Acidobacteriota bacterium]